jgi:hypothetical protein
MTSRRARSCASTVAGVAVQGCPLPVRSVPLATSPPRADQAAVPGPPGLPSRVAFRAQAGRGHPHRAVRGPRRSRGSRSRRLSAARDGTGLPPIDHRLDEAEHSAVVLLADPELALGARRSAGWAERLARLRRLAVPRLRRQHPPLHPVPARRTRLRVPPRSDQGELRPRLGPARAGAHDLGGPPPGDRAVPVHAAHGAWRQGAAPCVPQPCQGRHRARAQGVQGAGRALGDHAAGRGVGRQRPDRGRLAVRGGHQARRRGLRDPGDRHRHVRRASVLQVGGACWPRRSSVR